MMDFGNVPIGDEADQLKNPRLSIGLLWRKLTYPRKLESFFTTQRCPDCGSSELLTWQDGGHDEAIECKGCHAKFGVQNPPFNMIERIP